MVFSVLSSCVRAWDCADMAGNHWQEWAAFLTARGDLCCTKGVVEHGTGTVTMDMDIEEDGVEDPDAGTEEDDPEVFADQRARQGNWSRTCINRAVLVGTSINPDSNASIKAKRPQYWTPKPGVCEFYCFNECL